MSEAKKLERLEPGQSEKLARLIFESTSKDRFKMIANLVHGLNNLFMIIQYHLEKLEELTDTDNVDSKFTEHLDIITQKSSDAAGTLRSFGEAYRYTAPESMKKVTSVNKIFENIKNVANQILEKAEIELNVNLENEGLIECHVGQISQVFLELILNSYEAIRSDKESKKWVNVKGYTFGEKYILVVSDNGQGIEQEVREKMFEPFFTTKNPKNNFGIGLHICRTLLLEHGGHIIYDDQSENTTFIVELNLLSK